MQNCQINLSLGEVNQILIALGKQPYEEVFQLVAKIHEQSAPQLENSGEVTPDVPKPDSRS